VSIPGWDEGVGDERDWQEEDESERVLWTLAKAKLISPGTFRSNVLGSVRPREQDESAIQADEDQIEQPPAVAPILPVPPVLVR
jgi:hypothetical protein